MKNFREVISALLKSLQTEFPEESIQLDDLDPVSIWFSYGSNLYAPDFESKMKKYGAVLSLLSPTTCSLSGNFERKLNNKSKTRGLAYALHELSRPISIEERVKGVIHYVPIADLCAFLRFEGVLNSLCKVMPKGERRYHIKRASVILGKDLLEVGCFTLLGALPVSEEEKLDLITEEGNYEKLNEYVLTAMKGAIDFGIDLAPFKQDLTEIKELRSRGSKAKSG